MLGFSKENTIFVKTAVQPGQTTIPLYKSTKEIIWLTDDGDWDGMNEPAEIGLSYSDEVEDAEQRKTVEIDMGQTLAKDLQRYLRKWYNQNNLVVKINWIEEPRWLTRAEVDAKNLFEQLDIRPDSNIKQYINGAVQGTAEIMVFAEMPGVEDLEEAVEVSLNSAKHTGTG